LPRLYESLKRQSCTDFEWLVVDDGSTDNTEELIRQWMAEDNPFPIRYYKQPNGGKCRAFNRGVQLAKGTWHYCLDSDDYLVDDCLAKIKPYCDELATNPTFNEIISLKVTPKGVTLGTPADCLTFDTDDFSFRQILKVKGDRAHFIKNEGWKRFPFPEFEGEKFLSEGCSLMQMSIHYKSRVVNIPVQVCEYQEGGLTDNSGALKAANPLGEMWGTKVLFTHPKATLRMRCVWAMRYATARDNAKKKGVTIPEMCQPTPFLSFLCSVTPLLKLALFVKKGLNHVYKKD